MTQEFHREDRYIVIKHKDLGNVPVAYREHLVRPLFALQAHLPVRECVVVESDWPEYEMVWRMIEARVTGVMPAGGEVEVVGRRDAGGRCITHGGSGRYNDPLVRLEDHRAQVTRLQAEVSALQQRLNAADQRVDELETALGGMLFAFDDGVGRDWSAPLLDHTRKLCKAVEFKSAPSAKLEEHLCLLCLDEKTVPGPNAGDFARDCPDCCGEEG